MMGVFYYFQLFGKCVYKKKLQVGKPDSVVGYHLSAINITVVVHLPTL